MTLLRRLKAWREGRRQKAPGHLLEVSFDATEVRLRVLDRLQPSRNQTFAWSDITRVCFQDEGFASSDLLFVELRGHQEPVAIPTEAKGGLELFAALGERGLFPDEVRGRAVRETSGGAHCWPPRDRAS